MASAFLKWIGGKSRFTTQLQACAPPEWERIVEPFMGSAALFFAAEPKRALMADMNEDLVICFNGVAEDYRGIIALLDQMPNTKECFLEVRKRDPEKLTKIERAARVIYLNKTCFRGMWRVNLKGGFNVPYGAYDRPLYNENTMREAAVLLAGAEILHQSYEKTMASTKSGDWVFLDPPYVPAGGYADFTRYTTGQFRIEDHLNLVKSCRDLSELNIPFLLTNTNNQEARELYGGFNLHTLETKRDVALKAANRPSQDLVVSNYTLPGSAPITKIDADGNAF